MRDKALKILAVSITLLMVVSSVAPCIAVVANSIDADSDFIEFEDNLSEVEGYSEQPFERAVNKNDSRSVVILSSNTIYVPDDYAKIQWAVDNASDGDTIIVRDGTYTENVDVNKSLTIQSENGSASTIVQAADSNDHVFEVTADYVNLSGFTVRRASWGHPYYPAGIYLDNARYCGISKNKALNNCYGIRLYPSSDNNITNNIASNNHVGIYQYSSNNNIIIDNIASNNDCHGIYIGKSMNNIIANNVASSNNQWGIAVADLSKNNIITNNTVNSNSLAGIWMYLSNDNTLTNNKISENKKYGIHIDYLNNNNNIYLNNFVNNSDNVYSEDSTNIWNSTQPITYTYSSNTYTNYLGNCWDDYTDVDINGDGIWDNPYSTDSNNQDYYPLIERFENYFSFPEPICKIELREHGTTSSIDEVNVCEFFDIYVGDSTDDQGIKEVRFSSDESQDGNLTMSHSKTFLYPTFPLHSK